MRVYRFMRILKLFSTNSCTSRRFRYCEDLPRRRKSQFFSILTIVTGLFYIYWITIAANKEHTTVAYIFVLSEFSCLLLFMFATIGLWELRYKPEEGHPAPVSYSVDVLIPTYSEPMQYLEMTLRAASHIHYDGQITRYVLDDAGRSEVEELARTYGFRYLSRPKSKVPNENAKAGNLNFGLRNSQGDLVLVLDADQVAQPNIVQSLAGYMRFDSVAFVQSKQSYLTQEGDPFYNKSQVFYDIVQLAMDNNDTALSCGSGVLYRRAALESIGGFVEWNIVEDLTTSYELHAHGWKSFYFPHSLSRGLAPTSIGGVYQQRGQWALDTMRIFLWDNPFFKKGLRFVTRIEYSTVALSYICSAFIFPFFYLVPIWSYVTGNTILVRPEQEFIAVRAFYFLVMAMATRYLCHGQQPGKQFRMLAGLFPIYMKGIVRAFFYPKGRKPGYCPNNATLGCSLASKKLPPLFAVLPQIIIVLLNLVMPFVSLFAGLCDPKIIAANILISAIAIWSLSLVVWSTLFPGDWEPEEDPEHVYSLD